MVIRNISCESLHHSEESKAYSICCLISWRICIFLSRNLFLERNLIIHKYMQSQDKIQTKLLLFLYYTHICGILGSIKNLAYVPFSIFSENLSCYSRFDVFFKPYCLCIILANAKSNDRINRWDYRIILHQYVWEYWDRNRENLCQ